MTTLLKIMDTLIEMTLECLFMVCITFFGVLLAVMLGA